MRSSWSNYDFILSSTQPLFLGASRKRVGDFGHFRSAGSMQVSILSHTQPLPSVASYQKTPEQWPPRRRVEGIFVLSCDRNL